MRCFSHPYFPVHEQNYILIFPYMDKLQYSVHIQETLDTILSLYEKMRITKSRYFKLLYTWNYVNDQNSSWSSTPWSSSGLTLVFVPLCFVTARFSKSLIRKSTAALVQPSFIGSTTAPSKQESKYRKEWGHRTKVTKI